MRCFIAARPDPPTRIALSALSDDLRTRVEHRRATHIDDLHLTLAFIGDLSDGDALDVGDAAAALRFVPVDWQLDTLGFFEAAGIVWAGCNATDAIAPLLELGRRLRQLLDLMNIEYDRRPLAPHITLLRGVRRFAAQQIGPPISWRVDSVALYRSSGRRPGSRYSRVGPA